MKTSLKQHSVRGATDAQQVVALPVVGSTPTAHPKCFLSIMVVQLICNQLVTVRICKEAPYVS